ncbi:hypothetical protein [Microbacterium invictum]|uniref:Uncharacterized protein n=1 Tax=Microbacterium invictum TaxID=515415 RepID=A0ABZ0VDA0_9MICO|nr:hypothetical protein [Microbacterium invictum]WQB70878.1 hypothetical protein T9R20_02655 [Microbacterium invictum]
MIVLIGGALLLTTVLLGSLPVDAMTAVPFTAYVTMTGVAYLLILVGFLLLRAVPLDGNGWWALATGGSLWLVHWSWPFFLGWIIPVPATVLALLATGALVIGSGLFFSRSDPRNGTSVGILSVGSFISMGIMLANPVFGDPYMYLPLALAAILAGIAWIATARFATST